MNFSREIGFVVAAVATALILHLIPYDRSQVALYRMDNRVREDPTIRSLLTNQCSELTSDENSKASQYFLRRFASEAKGGESSCRVHVQTAKANRLYLRDYWHFILYFHTDDGKELLKRSYRIEFPRPLCLLPLAMFLLALIFEFRAWGLGLTLGSYVFLLGGGNLIQTFSHTLRSSYYTFRYNHTFIGLILITLWLSLLRSRKYRGRSTSAIASSPLIKYLNQVLSFLVGLWNPAVFTLGGKLFLPVRGSVGKLEKFMDGQMILIALSLYLLSLDLGNLTEFVKESILIPRYFSFALIAFLTFKYLTPKEHRPTAVWQQTRLWRGVLFVALTELVSLKVPQLRAYPTIIRVGAALLASELVLPFSLTPKLAAKNFLLWSLTIFAGSFLFLASVETGITDLVFVLWEPRAHPTAVALFTFLAGLFLGFLTGNFSTTFFTVYSLMIVRFDVPLVKAALIDGILAGSLLSPFSLFNLIPSAQFGISLQEMVKTRISQLTLPMVIAIIIYAVCTINSVAILQPVTFIFLVLVGLVLKLKKQSWSLGQGNRNEIPTL